MIRTATPRPVRVGTAMAGVAGMLVLAGCGASTEAETPDTGTDTAPSAAADSGAGDSADGATTYADGTYTATGSYQTPESVEQIEVTITLEGDVITAVEVVGEPTRSESEEYQGKFIGGIEDEVVGKSIDEISVSRVAGSSLTSGGFNDAVETIKDEAAA